MGRGLSEQTCYLQLLLFIIEIEIFYIEIKPIFLKYIHACVCIYNPNSGNVGTFFLIRIK